MDILREEKNEECSLHPLNLINKKYTLVRRGETTYLIKDGEELFSHKGKSYWASGSEFYFVEKSENHFDVVYVSVENNAARSVQVSRDITSLSQVQSKIIWIGGRKIDLIFFNSGAETMLLAISENIVQEIPVAKNSSLIHNKDCIGIEENKITLFYRTSCGFECKSIYFRNLREEVKHLEKIVNENTLSEKTRQAFEIILKNAAKRDKRTERN